MSTCECMWQGGDRQMKMDKQEFWGKRSLLFQLKSWEKSKWMLSQKEIQSENTNTDPSRMTSIWPKFYHSSFKMTHSRTFLKNLVMQDLLVTGLWWQWRIRLLSVKVNSHPQIFKEELKGEKKMVTAEIRMRGTQWEKSLFSLAINSKRWPRLPSKQSFYFTGHRFLIYN